MAQEGPVPSSMVTPFPSAPSSVAACKVATGAGEWGVRWPLQVFTWFASQPPGQCNLKERTPASQLVQPEGRTYSHDTDPPSGKRKSRRRP
ncbi:uncharacterized protein LOC119873350 isoform X2 [Canis lupus familiaris]|uniref:uncharacterized protein LOC119873350 isoform X2 n=1 Tax=Canis lupus familiaris TaxID=9615 RepID=UPI0018F668A7|nr:uncharacterized protein LOC119873350 isoform X2 [Canis lupus familiaris]XP_038471603.1 uncharacterized protein LOC119873350 isoform X2 [Canis lupus familiaris]XP_038534041.1 uncharacterized protein LOC119873350 isoform X2 [Canis lupus familiaris]